MVTASEVEEIGLIEGLVAGALRLGRSNYDNAELVAALARGASSRASLTSDAEVEVLAALSRSRFFDVQVVLCEVIPLLEAPMAEVLALTSMLVEMGGEDMAANQPNAAFRKWCAEDVGRAEEVIASARRGDAQALRHLVFALEAKGDVEEAFRSAATDGEERAAGALALSRMALGEGEARRAVAQFLAVAQESDPEERAGLINAALDVAGKHPALDRTSLGTALDRLSSTPDPVTVHLLANALYWHGGKMSDAEVASCLRGIQLVDPENIGTVQQIEAALRRLWPSRPDEVGQAIAPLISATKGRVGVGALDGILSAQEQDHGSTLARLATNWLLEGDFHVCSALSSHVSEIERSMPCFEVTPDDLPSGVADQIFVCRKAVGYFFLAPMTAAAWIVATLRKGGPAAQDAAELLFDPLLLNYGGALKVWLEGLVVENAPENKLIDGVLTRAQEVWDGFDAASDVVELEPSSSQRALVRFQEAEEAERVQEAAREKSVFAQIVTTQTLLYGDRSSFSIRDGNGERRPRTVDMAEISVSSELPKGLIFDPVGTEWMLEVFRHELRASS